jgi:hypothetical protein
MIHHDSPTCSGLKLKAAHQNFTLTFPRDPEKGRSASKRLPFHPAHGLKVTIQYMPEADLADFTGLKLLCISLKKEA